MLGRAQIEAVVPVSDVEKAISFYGATLGLNLVEQLEDVPGYPEALFDAGGGGALVVYQSAAAGKSAATVASFMVDELDSVVAGLRERGVAFEDYDVPGLKTENGIATLRTERVGWFKDPDGNIVAVASRIT